MAIALFLSGRTGLAGNIDFQQSVQDGSGNYDWDNPANWVGGVLPGTSDTAYVNNANATILSGDNLSVMDIEVGQMTGDSSAIVNQTGGTIAINRWFEIGQSSNATYNLSGGESI